MPGKRSKSVKRMEKKINNENCKENQTKENSKEDQAMKCESRISEKLSEQATLEKVPDKVCERVSENEAFEKVYEKIPEQASGKVEVEVSKEVYENSSVSDSKGVGVKICFIIPSNVNVSANLVWQNALIRPFAEISPNTSKELSMNMSNAQTLLIQPNFPPLKFGDINDDSKAEIRSVMTCVNENGLTGGRCSDSRVVSSLPTSSNDISSHSDFLANEPIARYYSFNDSARDYYGVEVSVCSQNETDLFNGALEQNTINLLLHFEKEVLENDISFTRQTFFIDYFKQHKYRIQFERRFNVIQFFRNNVPKEFAESSPLNTFWSHVLMGACPRALNQNDFEVLRFLVDVRMKFDLDPNPSFTLEFFFEPNNYFEDQVLLKTYIIDFEADEGTTIKTVLGSQISWTEMGKKWYSQLPVSSRLLSFFDFFLKPKLLQDFNKHSDVIQASFLDDIRMGYLYKNHIIPKATHYFLHSLNKMSS